MADVTDNPTLSRFELATKGIVAIAEYHRSGDVLEVTHTEVPPAVSGRGIGTALVRGMLDRIRADGLTVRPLCPVVAAVIARHPEYGDLVAADRG